MNRVGDEARNLEKTLLNCKNLMSNVLENNKDVKKAILWCCLFCSTTDIDDGLKSVIFNYLFTYDMNIL